MLPGHLFPIINLLTFPLIMYNKFVWSNLVWLVKCQSWLENVAIIISSEIYAYNIIIVIMLVNRSHHSIHHMNHSFYGAFIQQIIGSGFISG